MEGRLFLLGGKKKKPTSVREVVLVWKMASVPGYV
jgi:hypothetical protein